MRPNRVRLFAILISYSLLLPHCASSPPSADEPTATEEAPAASQSGDTSSGMPDDEAPGPQAARKYDEWCTYSRYGVGFPQSSQLVLRRSVRRSFDDKGRVILESQDANGDGVDDKVIATSYEPDGVHYTQETVTPGKPETTRVTQGKRQKFDPRFEAFTRVNRVNADDYRNNDAGEPIGFRRKALRFVDRHDQSMPRTEVEEAGVFILNEAGFPEAVFVARGTNAESSVPEIEDLRAQIHLGPHARRWTWAEASDWNITAIFQFAYYDDSGQVLTQATWENPTAASAPTLAAIADTITLDTKHQFHATGVDKALIVDLPEAYRTHLSSLILRAYNAAGKKVRERHYDGKLLFPKPDLPGVRALTLETDLRLEYDGGGHLIRFLVDSSPRIQGRAYADGIVDRITEFTRDGDVVVERRELLVSFGPDVTLAQVPEKWRSVTVADKKEGNPRNPEIVLESMQTTDRDAHGNVLRTRTKTIHAVRHLRYDDRGQLVEIDADGPDGNIPRADERTPGLSNVQVRHQYDATGRKTQTQRTENPSLRELTTTWTNYTFDAQGRVTREALQRQSVRGFGGDRETTGPDPWLTRKHSYDNQGRLEKTVITGLTYPDLDAVLSYTYDDSGRLIAETKTPRKSEASTRRYIYEGARLVAEEVQMLKQDQPHYRVEYHYDSDGRKIRAVHWGMTNVTPVTIPPRLAGVTEYTYKGDQLVQEVDQYTSLDRYGYECHDE